MNHLVRMVNSEIAPFQYILWITETGQAIERRLLRAVAVHLGSRQPASGVVGVFEHLPHVGRQLVEVGLPHGNILLVAIG